jgi:hypothetical protein
MYVNQLHSPPLNPLPQGEGNLWRAGFAVENEAGMD